MNIEHPFIKYFLIPFFLMIVGLISYYLSVYFNLRYPLYGQEKINLIITIISIAFGSLLAQYLVNKDKKGELFSFSSWYKRKQ